MAEDIQSNIKINVDTTSAMDSIRLLQNQISAFHTQMSKMGAASAADSRNMQQNLINSINSTGAFTANMTKVKTTAEQFTTSLERNKLSMGEYFRYAGGASKTFGRAFQAEFETINKVARERVKDLQSQYIKLGRDANGAMQAIRVRPLVLDMDNLGTKTQIAAQRQQLLNQLLKQGSTNLLNFGKNTQWAGRQLMVGFTIPLSIMGAAAMKSYKEIEEAGIRLRRVYGDFGTTNVETEKMVKDIQRLALEYTKYGVAVKDSMQMAADAAAMGKKGADLLAQVSSSARLAVLGGVDQQMALKTTTSLTDAFGVSTKQLAKDINFLNAVENQTVLSIEDMTIAIPKAAPVIQQLGGDVKDLAFFLTAMKEGGINASESANALKSGLASLINPTNTASKMLQGFGINLREIVQGNKGDVKKTVVDFAQALDKLDPLNRAKAIEQLFGKFQFARMSTLFKNVIEQGSQASQVLKLASASSLELSMLAQRELNKIESSPLFKFQKSIADFQAALAPVGEQFMKALTPIINFGTDVLNNFNNLGEGVKGFIVKFVAVAGVVGPVLLMSFGLIANAVANVIKGFALMKDIFNKTGKSSLSLGEQVNYMTQEQIQAAAIASSLDQVHSKLKQTFTSEAAAVDALTAAYQRSVLAQKAFNVPITPRGPVAQGPVKKYAAGGIISGPGTGTSDSILAMVSNGEAIIPAASVARNPGVVRQLVSGNIPGFQDGVMPGIRPDTVRAYTDFTALLSKGANAALTSNAASRTGVIREFTSNPGAIQGPLIASLAEQLGGAKSQAQINKFLEKNPNVIKYAESLSTNIAGELSKLTTEKIGDKDLAPAVQRAIAKTPASKEIASAVQKLSTIPTTFEDDTKLRQRSDGRLMAIGREKLTNLRGRYTSIYNRGSALANRLYPGNTIVDPRAAHLTLNEDIPVDELERRMSAQGVPLSPQATSAIDRKRRGVVSYLGQEVPVGNTAQLQAEVRAVAKAEGKKISGAAADGVVQGMAEEGQMRSPSRKTKQKGAELVQGAVQGMQEGVDDVRRAGSQLGQAAAQGVSQSGRVPGQGSRRSSSEGNLIFIPGQGYVSEGQIARDAALANSPMIGPREGTRLEKFKAGMNAGSIYRNIQSADPDKLAGSIRNKSFGAAGGLAVGSMLVPGEMGQMMGMASMLTSFGGMGAGGIAKGMKSLSKETIGLGLKFLKFVPYVGAAVVAFEAFDTLIVPLIRKNADAYKAITDTLSITQEKLDKVNGFFGTDAKLAGIRATVAVTGDQTKEQGTIAEQFQQTQEFKDLYQESAQRMGKLSDQEFKRAMEAYSVDLFGMGYEAEAVKAIIDAIAIEAKKTSVSIAPELFSLDDPKARQLMNKNINKIISETTKQVQDLESQIDSTFLSGLFEDENTKMAISGKYDNFFARPMTVDPETIEKLKANTAQIGSYISALGAQFQNGTLSAKDFTIQYDRLIAITKTMPGTSGIEMLIESVRMLNPELAKALSLINAISGNSKSIALVAEAASLGIATNTEAGLALALPDTEENSPLIAAAQAAYEEAINKTKKNSEDIAAEEKKIKNVQKQSQGLANTEEKINEKYDKRISQLEKIKRLNDQLAKSQQGQLTLAEALNKGDIAAAARAAIDIQNNDIQASLDNQKQGMDDARKAEVAPLKAAQEANTAAVDTLTDKIETLNKKTFEIEFKLPTGKEIKYEESAFGTDFWGMLGYNLANFFNNKVLGAEWTGNKIVPPGNPPELVDKKKASGGHITGPGTGTSDSIPAMLSNGEYVIRANAVKTIGVDTLNKLNQADRLGFAAGGMVRAYRNGGMARGYNNGGFISDSGWYDASPNLPVDKKGNRLNVFNNDGGFLSAKAAEVYYTGLIRSRRFGVSAIEQSYQKNLEDKWMTQKESNNLRINNLINNRTYGKFNGLDQEEAKTFSLALSKLYGKKGMESRWSKLGFGKSLLSKKPIAVGKREKSWWELQDKFLPKLSVNAPKFAEGGMVGYKDGGKAKNWDLKDPSAPWNQGDFKKFNDYQTRKQYWAMGQPGSREIVGAGKTAGYFLPGIGSGLAFGDAGTAFGKGDVGGGLLNAAFGFGAMWIPKAIGMIGKGIGQAADFVKTGLGIRGGSNALKAAASSTGADVSKVGKLTPRLGFNLSDAALQNMIKDNFYGNMRVPGIRSSTSDSLMNRIAVEKNMMGIPANAPASKTPAYGFLTTKEDVPSYYNSIMGGMGPRSASQEAIDDFNLLVNPMSRYLGAYGNNTIKLKPGALGKSTISMGDSLSIWDKAIGLGQKIPRVNKLSSIFSTFPALSGKLGATQNMMRKDVPGKTNATRFPYIEAHLPGGFTIKDIESIMLNPTGRFGPQATEKIAADLAERKAALEAMFESMGIKGITITENGGIKIGKETLGGNYPLPSRGAAKTAGSPLLPVSGPMQGASLPFGFSKAPTKAEMDAVVAFIQNSPLAQIQRGDALASIVGKSTIAKGTSMFRVPTIRQNQELATKNVGDIIDLGKRFTSIAGQSELQAIGMTAAGKLNTGNRELPVNTIIKFVAGENIPGILNHKVYNQNYLKNAFGKKADEYPFQSEGLLPPGLKGKIVGVSQSGDQRILEVLLSKFAKGGMVRKYANGGMVPIAEPAPKQFANGGYAMGTDTVPAMLTPGEFVIKKSAVDRIGPSTLNKINRFADGGLVGGMPAVAGESVYNSNTYEINVNVSSNSNPDQIANAVMSKIRQIDNKRVRGSAF
jgi:TP901 family phage tail tape measure protein